MTVTLDSRIYREPFYGILNANGAFWTPLVFESEKAAETHLERFWGPDKWQGHKRSFKIVPVRIQLTALPRDSRLKREAPRREARLGPKGESGGAVRQSPKICTRYPTDSATR